MNPLISIVIPAMNEVDNIGPLERRLLAALEGQPYEFEFVVVDNGSTDGTAEAVREICGRDARWRYVQLSRNFGIDASLMAGYRISSGEAIVVLYSDMQDPPEVIPAFLEKWQEGFDVVYGVRTVRPGDPRWRNAVIGLAYRAIAALADVSIPTNAGDFRLISRRVRDALNACEERNRYTRGLIAWLGFRQVGIEYRREPRSSGESKFSLGALIAFALDAFTSFSLKPLRVFTILGFALLAVSLLAVPFYVWLYFVSGAPQGVTTLIVLALLGIGVNSLGIGVLGEYLGRTYAESKRRPLFVIADSTNVPADILPHAGVSER